MSSSPSPTPSPPPRTTRKAQRQKQQRAVSSNYDIPITLTMATPMRLLVCSIGNPAPYTHTLHSAGHTVLNALANALSYPPFQKSRTHGNGLLSSSASTEWTLYQSPSYMNVSGPAVASAWRTFLKTNVGVGETARLVVLHDELELAFGQVKVRKGDASPKGHNGLKSIKEQMRGAEWWRIGVGIGRPLSREPDDVASFVLRKMSAMERGKMESSAALVEGELRRLAG